jgi:glycosyltransferase involved in cell wall biosynthesis
LRHALFVTFHYPPEASSSGVLRTLKYTRYLEERGWRVTVIAPEVAAYEVVDASLETQIPASTKVVRTRFVNIKRHLSWRGIYPGTLALPDVWIGWLPYAVAAGRRVIAQDPVDLIYSTSPHATAHLIAARLAASSGKPWVTDFRDPWIEDPPEPGTPNGFFFRTTNRWLERKVVHGCDAVATSTTQLRDLLRTRYPEVPSDKIGAILNGYDEADFGAPPEAVSGSGARLRIVHAGSINGEFRDPAPLFAALGRIIRRGRLAAAECELRFIGGGPYTEAPALRAAIDAAGLTDSVKLLPRVPYDESLRELGGADLLLLLQASEDTVGLVPAKLYEYLRAQKPTLALVHVGAVTDVMKETGGGWSVDPRDEGALDATLAAIVDAWRTKRLAEHRASLDMLRRFDRRALTGELAARFDALVAASARGVAPVPRPTLAPRDRTP